MRGLLFSSQEMEILCLICCFVLLSIAHIPPHLTSYSRDFVTFERSSYSNRSETSSVSTNSEDAGFSTSNSDENPIDARSREEQQYGNPIPKHIVQPHEELLWS